MFTPRYWTRSYWTGTYWPPSGIPVSLWTGVPLYMLSNMRQQQEHSVTLTTKAMTDVRVSSSGDRMQEQRVDRMQPVRRMTRE